MRLGNAKPSRWGAGAVKTVQLIYPALNATSWARFHSKAVLLGHSCAAGPDGRKESRKVAAEQEVAPWVT